MTLFKYISINLLIILVHANANAQDLSYQISIVPIIKSSSNWSAIREEVIEMTNKSATDILVTESFIEEFVSTNLIDSLFLNICVINYSYFPYRQSGNMQDSYSLTKLDDANPMKIYSSISLSKVFEKKSKNELIPKLISYLKVDAATRLIINEYIYDEPTVYLRISDFAMELLELYSLCDFYDNASFPSRLFSNIDKEKRNEIIEKIERWYFKTKNLSLSESVEVFLETEFEKGYTHSFWYTCNNLLFKGYKETALNYYAIIYERASLPCKDNFTIGTILLKHGDRRLLEDASNKIFNYKCMYESGIEYMNVLLTSNHPYKDNLLAELVSTEPHSIYRNKTNRPRFAWQSLLGKLADRDADYLPLTLKQFTKIKTPINELKVGLIRSWNKKYDLLIDETFRVCDLALIKLLEKEGGINHVLSVNERDSMISELVREK